MSINHNRINFAAILLAACLIGAILPSRAVAAQSTTLSITPVADATVNEKSPDTNAGSEQNLLLEKKPVASAYIKFNVSSVGTGKVTRAVLRIYADSDNPKGYDVYAVSSSSWQETDINYSNAPTMGKKLKTSGSVSIGTWNDIDITGYITGDGTYSLGLASSFGRPTLLSAREDKAHAPQLLITVTSAEPTIAPTVKLPTPMPTQTEQTAASPTARPTNTPGVNPSTPAPSPTNQPVASPTVRSTNIPTANPITPVPSLTIQPADSPTASPTTLPSPTATSTNQASSGISSQTIYYVATTGSDGNPGTSGQPWRTIQKAANTLAAGQTVKILPGTYSEKFTPVNSGTANGYITYTADPGTVILDGSGVSLSPDYKGDGLVQIQGKSYIKVQNLTLRNASVNCVNVSENSSGKHSSFIELTGLNLQNCTKKGIQIRYADNVLVKDNNINHISYSSGIGVWYTTYATIDHNTITNAHYYHECQGAYDEALTIASVNHFEVKNNTLDNTEANPAGFCTTYFDKLGIDVKQSSQNGLVYRNTIRHMNAAGIYVDGWDAGSSGTPTLNHINIYQNRVSDGGGIVVGCEQSDGVVEYINIYDNLVINAYFSGIQVRGAWGDGLRKNIVIENNTIYGASTSGGNGGAGIYVTTAHLGSNNGDAPVIIRNNISLFYFLSTGGGTVGQIRAGNSTMASMVAADHNLVYGPQSCSQEYPSCVEMGARISASATGVFTNPGSYDLHLRSGSPAIDAGVTLSAVTVDYDGVSRPQGSADDIGAYEYR